MARLEGNAIFGGDGGGRSSDTETRGGGKNIKNGIVSSGYGVAEIAMMRNCAEVEEAKITRKGRREKRRWWK